MPSTVESATSATGPSPGTSSPSRSTALERVVDACGGEQNTVEVAAPDDRIGDLEVQRRPLVVEPPKLVLVARERAIAPTDALPRSVGIDLEKHDERVVAAGHACRGT